MSHSFSAAAGALLGVAIQTLPAQGAPSAAATALHTAVASADLVVVARHAGVATHGSNVRLHRLEILSVLKGDARVSDKVSVVDFPKLSLHQRPVPQQTRLYCLLDFKKGAERAGLTAERGPFFQMTGHTGSSPLILGEAKQHPYVQWARIVARATEERLAVTAEAAAAVALGPDATLRREASKFLIHRKALRDTLTPITWSSLVSRAIGETKDVGFKIALAELCTVQKTPGLIQNLCMSVPSVDDPRFPRFLGRAATSLHGEAGADILRGQASAARTRVVRDRFLLALGATGTQTALNALIKMQRDAPRRDPGIIKALEAHGSRQALEAAARKK